jgi:Domain of unknown function (DUF4329)
LKAGLWGAVSAAAFWGIGTAFSKIATANLEAVKGGTMKATQLMDSGLTSGQTIAKIAAHAGAGGTLNVLQGGKFGHGFISAGFTEALSPAVGQLGEGRDFGTVLAKTAVSAAIGGTASKLSGGSFANGAATGAFQQLFNHIATGIKLSALEKKLSKIAGENLDKYNEQSIKEDREIGGVIYRDGKGNIRSTKAIFGVSCVANDICGVNLVGKMNELSAEGNDILSSWHTHGTGEQFNIFSPEDLALFTDLKNQAFPEFVGGFIGTPDRKIQYYRYGTLGTNPESILKNSTDAQISSAQIFIRPTKGK